MLNALLLLYSCNKIELASVNYNFIFNDAIAILDDSITYKSGYTAKIDIKTVLLSEHYVFSPNQGSLHIDTIEFHTGPDWSYTLDSTSYNPVKENRQYSAALVWDKTMTSGWGEDYADAFNYVMEKSFEEGNELMLLGSVRNSENNGYIDYSDNFLNVMDNDSRESLYNMISDEVEGTSSLYDAVDFALEELNDHAIHENKQIVVFWDNEDDSLGISKDDLILKALDYGIKISFCRVEHSYDPTLDPLEITLETGGFFTVSGSTASFYNVLFSMESLLSESYYTLTFHFNLYAPWVASSQKWYGEAYVNYYLSVPFVFNYD